MSNDKLFQYKQPKSQLEDIPSINQKNGFNKIIDDKKLEKEYHDQEGLSIKRLKIGLWFVERREKIKKLLIGFLIFVSVISWLFVIISVVYYFAVGIKSDDKMIAQVIENDTLFHNYILSVGARDLMVSSPVIFDSGNGKYDFISELQNPNKDYFVEFSYFLEIDGQTIAEEKGYALPEEKKQLLFLGKELVYRPGSTNIKIGNISWKRINKHEIPNWPDYYNSRLNFLVENVNFVGSRDTGILQAAGLNNLEFEVTNKTPFNFWLVNFNILLFNNNNVVAVNKYGISEFMSGTTKKIKMSWPGDFNKVTNIIITPDLNIFANDIYIKFQGGVGQGE